MVLGVQCLKSLGPILWDFQQCMLAFVRNGHHVLWTAIGAPDLHLSLLTPSAELLDDLLLTFDTVLTEPTGLPPLRQRCPYCYTNT
jgi:hypothetical protein